MLVINANCPDCDTRLTVVRELPDESARVEETPCPGCFRPWGAIILTHRLVDGSLMYTPRLVPLDGLGRLRRIQSSRRRAAS
jgi:hypothetical protein